jgi:6-phosphogluconolactonase
MGVKRYVASLPVVIGCSYAALYSQVSNAAPKQTTYFLYVGTYGKGIQGYRFDAAHGTAESLGIVGAITNPSFVATDPQHRYLYAVSELEGKVNGNVAAFAIQPSTGALKPLNVKSSEGQAPCHVSVDQSGKVLAAANYTTGEVPIYPIQPDGSLGEMSQCLKASGHSVNKERQSGPHAHETVWSPDNHFLYVPDLGLDHIRIYKFDAAAGKLAPANPPFAALPGGHGPRHIAISSDGKFAYVINELQPVFTVFSRDITSGALTKQLQEISVVPEGYTGENAPAEIAIHAGRHVYASDRGPGSISVFSIGNGGGNLKSAQTVQTTGATWPRGFEFDPTGQFLLIGDQKANKFAIFSVDANTGNLTPTGKQYDVPSPVSFVFVPVAR